MAKKPSFTTDPYSGRALLHAVARRVSRSVQTGKPSGVSHDGCQVIINNAGDCSQPYRMLVHQPATPDLPGRPSTRVYNDGWVWLKGIVPRSGTSEMRFKFLHRCRKCENCAKFRSRVWMARACSECEVASVHHYFGTFTFSPTWAKAKGCEGAFDTEDAAELASRELTLALKRHRKKNRVRYFAVLERGELRGRLHWHVLIHSPTPLPAFVIPNGKIRHSFNGWHAGFTDIEQLAKDGEHWKAAAYVSKYITKARGVRVRASQGYGGELSDTTGKNNSLDFGQSIAEHWDEID